MADEVVRDFPLFPLGIVALPHEIVPLHIFEERYQTMIAEGLERADDGRMNLLTRGTRPFRIIDEQADLPYPAGTVEFLTDKDEQADAGTAESARAAYNELVEQATDRTLEPDELDGMTAYQMAATVDFGREAKQGLLDLRSENARLRLVARLFRAAIKRLAFIERAQERARSNGKVRFG